MFGKITFWFVVLVLLSAPAGWHLAEKNKERKAAERAEMDRLREIAMIEQARLELERLRNEVKMNRESAVGTRIESVVMKNNKKPLERVTIKAFHDDGIAFSRESGVALVSWADLPDDLVKKYRDPVAAEASSRKASEEAALLAEMERLGQMAEVVFVQELADKKNPNEMSGSVLSLQSVLKEGQGWRDAHGYIFVVNISGVVFESKGVQRLRIYPVGQRIINYDMNKKGSVPRIEKMDVYAPNAALALKLAQEDHISLFELAKKKLGTF